MLNEKYKKYLMVLFAIFILFFLQFLNLLNLSGLINVANLWKEKNFQVLQIIANPFKRVTLLWKLTSRLEDLQYRYSEASANLIKINSLEQENQELRKLLENSDRSYRQVVITAPVVSFAQSFIAAGEQSGIKTGSAVLYKDTLLGLVDQVEDRQSSVLLLSKLTDFYILAETETGVKGIVKGNGREVLLTEIKNDDQIEIGQLVFTSSQLGIEKGLLIGRVAHVLTDNQALAVKTAIIEQLVNFYDTSLVEVK